MVAQPQVLVVAQPQPEVRPPKPGTALRHAVPVPMALPRAEQVEDLEAQVLDVVEVQLPLATPSSFSAVVAETSEVAESTAFELPLFPSGCSLLSASVDLLEDEVLSSFEVSEAVAFLEGPGRC